MSRVIIGLILLFGVQAQAYSKDEIETMIREVASVYEIDPDLAVAIATVESGLDPSKVGALSERGVFQLRPEYHKVSTDVKENIVTAMKYLSFIKEKWEPEYGDAWFCKFNLGPYYKRLKFPRLFPYYKKVMQTYNEMEG